VTRLTLHEEGPDRFGLGFLSLIDPSKERPRDHQSGVVYCVAFWTKGRLSGKFTREYALEQAIVWGTEQNPPVRIAGLGAKRG
jgi:hypothetical protein